jgi:colicin import membrane protein
MATSQEVRDRIWSAADALFAQSQNDEYPRIEDVRVASKAGMAAVVDVMKEWRQAQRQSVQAIRQPLPSVLQTVVQNTAQQVWETAQQLANESLEAARVAFEAEKADLHEMSNQQSAAFDTQALELVKVRGDLADREKLVNELAPELQRLKDVLREREKECAVLAERVAHAEQRSAELQLDLETVRAELAKTQASASAEAERHAEHRKRAGEDAHRISERLLHAERLRDEAREEAAAAREEVARVKGQLEATQAQNTEMLNAFRELPRGNRR